MKMRSISDLVAADEDTRREALSHVQFVPKIEQYLEDLNLAEHDRALGVFSASDIGNKSGRSLCGDYPMGCGRMLYYRYLSVVPQDNIPPRLRRIFDTGHKIHDQLQGYLNKVAADSDVMLFVDEARIDPRTSKMAGRYDIDSTTDGIWTINVPGQIEVRFGLEIKSMKDELFKKLNGADQSHIIQSHVYMACLDLPHMAVLYYNKNDSSMAEFVLTFEQKIWDAITAKIEHVRECAIDEEPPEREVGYHCKTCRYSFICKPPKREKRSLRMGRRRFALRGE